MEWPVYKDAKIFFSEMIIIVSRLPKEYRFELGSQAVRAALSIMLNIAEGSGKSSPRELNRFLDIALGSAHESVALIDVFRDNQFIDSPTYQGLFDRLNSITKQLGGFKKRVINR